MLLPSSQAKPLPEVEPERVGISSERLDRITKAFETRIEEKSLPGVVFVLPVKAS